MPLKVIGAGLGRTGTLSLKSALEELGFRKCYHMLDLVTHPEQVPVWDAATRNEPVDWDSFFEGYAATVDWPGCSFYREYMRLYPDAKVILTVRDPERWYNSARQTIYYVRHAFPGWVRVLLPRMRRFRTVLDRLIWVGMFQGRFEDRPFAIEVFNRHNDEVRHAVPPERLLVYDVKEGWGPLCAFLGVGVPEGKPFPHLNDTAEFRGRIERAARTVKAVAYTGLALVLILLAWSIVKVFLQTA
jgi:Sulfotransferase domain